MMSYVFFQTDDALDASTLSTRIGAKAANLYHLGQSFAIPAWFALSGEAFLSCLTPQQAGDFAEGKPIGEITLTPALLADISAALTALGDAKTLWAVRSSAIGEDGQDASFAGQLQSFLNISPENVAAHVIKVWQSALSDSVGAYRHLSQAATTPFVPAVLIQKMIAPHAAGVAFGCDPVTGERDVMVINAIAGLADRLVGGEENGDTYRLMRVTDEVTGTGTLLSEQQIKAVAALLAAVEAHFKQVMDMEWAMDAQGLYLLQARPVTTLKDAVSATDVVWDNSNIVESYSGVTSPLTFSFARYVYAHVYMDFCALMGVSEAKIKANHNRFWHMLGSVRGHVYYNLNNWYGLLALFPGFRLNRAFMEEMMGVKAALPTPILNAIVGKAPTNAEKWLDGLSLLRTLLGLIGHGIALKTTMKKFMARLESTLAPRDYEAASLTELAQDYRRIEGNLLAAWDAPLINDFLTMIAFGASRKLMQKWGGEAGLMLHADLMIGQGDIISAEPARLMRDMANIIVEDAHAIRTFVEADLEAIDLVLNRYPPLKELVTHYFATFSDRCLQELKLESPTLSDDPAILYRAVGQMARFGKREEAEARLTPSLSSVIGTNPLKLVIGKWLLNWAKVGVRNRENLRFERTRAFGRARKIFLAMGAQLTKMGQLEAANDIFMLEVEEVLGFVEGSLTTRDLKGLVALRHADHEAQKAMSPPPSRFIANKGLGEMVSGLIRPDPALERGLVIDENADAKSGIGCCRGIVRGRVRVITDPKGASLEAGEIMVAQFTDPGWIMLFVNAAGILVERGSLLSHSAIVAREMNIPAIVAIDGVMNWLKTGDMVEMDGASGVVRKVED